MKGADAQRSSFPADSLCLRHASLILRGSVRVYAANASDNPTRSRVAKRDSKMHIAKVGRRLLAIASLVLIAPQGRASISANQAILKATNAIRVAGSTISLRHPM